MINDGYLFAVDDHSEGTVAVSTKSAPLTSVWEGNDGQLIEAILQFYPTIEPHPILDSTYNAGKDVERLEAPDSFDGHRPAAQAHDSWR